MTEKNLIIRRHECLDKICQAINEAQLPSFVTAEILDRILAEVRSNADTEYRQSLAAYNASLADNAEEVES